MKQIFNLSTILAIALIAGAVFSFFFCPTAVVGQVPLDEWPVDIRPASDQMNDLAKQVGENLGKGYAVVIMPVSSKAYTGKNFVTNWTNEDLLGSTMLVESKNAFRVGRDDHAYEVMFVNPGRYALRGNYSVVGQETWRNISSKPDAPTGSGLGRVVFQYSEGWGLGDLKLVWHPAQYRVGYVNRTYCTSVFVGSGLCATTESGKYKEYIVTQEAGYKPQYTRKWQGKTGIFVVTEEPFAEFQVRAGEIVLIDSFFAQSLNYTFDKTRCYNLQKDTDIGKWCELEELRMQHIPASIDTFRKLLSKANGKNTIVMAWNPFNPNKKLARALSSVQYREVKISGKPVGVSDPDMGQTYSMKNSR